MRKDYYAVLGVPRDASQEDVKRAFRRLARETHPDANPGDPAAEARFREVAEAYEVLSDPERRRRYDRGDTIDLSDLFAGFGGFDDLIRSVFGDSGLFGAATQAPSNRGRDVLARVEIDLAEAAFGTEAEVRFRSHVACSSCGGDGAAPGAERQTCPSCNGSGSVQVTRRGLLGTVMSVAPCGRCDATGRVVTVPCPACGGRGVESAMREVKVEIPAGVSTGTRLRLTGQGEVAPRSGRRGDLFVEVVVRPDPRFERRGDDLVHEVVVGIAEAALGAEVEVPLLEGGSESLQVPGGTQPGWVTGLPGKGMGRLGRRGRGDLLVVVSVRVPEALSREEEEALRRFAEARGEHPAARRRRRAGR
jgi:molecular chaperone DnaJ